MQRSLKIGLGIALSIFGMLFMLTTYEYYIFCKQVARLRCLQDDYHGYLVLMNNAVEDQIERTPQPLLSEVHDSLELLETAGALEGNEEEGVETEEGDTDFLVVNRSAEYLRDAAITFYAQNNLHGSTAALTDAWEPYNDWHIKQRDQVPLKKKKTTSKVRTRSPQSRQVKLSRGSSGTARFAWPIDPAYFWLSSFYGPRKRKDGSPGFHHAIDMAAVKGTRVNAAAAGTVIEARYTAGWGNEVLIKHPENNGRFKTRYAHLDKIHVYVGQEVAKGTWIGNVGATGIVRKKGKDASHLHFEVYDRGKRINPLPLLG